MYDVYLCSLVCNFLTLTSVKQIIVSISALKSEFKKNPAPLKGQGSENKKLLIIYLSYISQRVPDFFTGSLILIVA